MSSSPSLRVVQGKSKFARVRKLYTTTCGVECEQALVMSPEAGVSDATNLAREAPKSFLQAKSKPDTHKLQRYSPNRACTSAYSAAKDMHLSRAPTRSVGVGERFLSWSAFHEDDLLPAGSWQEDSFPQS